MMQTEEVHKNSRLSLPSTPLPISSLFSLFSSLPSLAVAQDPTAEEHEYSREAVVFLLSLYHRSVCTPTAAASLFPDSNSLSPSL